jgi:riboflavin synthase
MFTGIVQGIGRIAQVEPRGDGVRIVVETAAIDTAEVAIGDSIAVGGCCLTVVVREAGRLAFDVSAETLRCTSGLDRVGDVNLEKALRMGDALGGHLMTGHVDGVGVVQALDAVHAGAPSGAIGAASVAATGAASVAATGAASVAATDAASVAATGGAAGDTSCTLVIEAPAELARFIAAKGSIAVQGVSLTVNEVHGGRFSINLIPHTLAVTTLGRLRAGDRVNLEIDLVARYVARLADAALDPLLRSR